MKHLNMDENSAFIQAINILAKNGMVITSLYQMKNKRYDQKIRKTSKKFFKIIDTIEIRSRVKNQNVTWIVEALKRK